MSAQIQGEWTQVLPLDGTSGNVTLYQEHVGRKILLWPL